MNKIQEKRIVLCSGIRTPIGHLSRSLSHIPPEHLIKETIITLLSHTSLYPHAVDGMMLGWVGQGSHAPNLARIAVLLAGLPEKAHATTIQENCVSGIEAVCSAVRHIVMGEGELYLAGGVESMSTFPYAIRGSRSAKSLRSLDMLKKNWGALWEDPEVKITDCMEEGLTDPVKNLSMAATAEVCAQMYSISRKEQDAYAFESFKRALLGQENGFYDSHVFPYSEEGQPEILKRDESPQLRADLVKKPEMIGKAPLLFDSCQMSIEQFYRVYGAHILGKRYQAGKTEGTVTLFNSCARSDGAAVIIVASEKRARELNLDILAEVRGWGFWGNNPAHMGISPVFATQLALDRAGVRFDDLDSIELHEAFAATCLSIFKVGKEKYGQNWQDKWNHGVINPHGGSIALGHPLAATGTRIILNTLYQMKLNHKRLGLATACAAGGLGGAIIVEKYV